jgi:hypothetical protein
MGIEAESCARRRLLGPDLAPYSEADIRADGAMGTLDNGLKREWLRLTAENARLLLALASCESWIDRWSQHVGSCEGADKCTCGRTAILYEARAAIEQKPIDQ